MSGATNKAKNKFLKLVKHDFLASARVISLFYIILAILMVVFAATVLMGKSDSLSIEFAQKLNTARNFSIAISIIVSFLLIFVTFFFVVYDFFKSLFSQQGYLSFTLPVSSNQLLGSKMLVYGGWMILSYAIFMFTGGFLINYAAENVIGQDNIGMIEMFMGMFGNMPSLTQIIAYVVYIIMVFFVIFLSFVSIIYFAITLSHIRVFQKASVIMSIIIFGITAAVTMIIAFKASDLVNFVMVFNDDQSLSFGILKEGQILANNALGWQVTPIFSFIIIDVALFFATSYTMHKKINLK